MKLQAVGLLSDIEQEQREQYTLRRIQLFNWGTFSGLHTIEVASKGFLILGPSGSGKSTILDAYAALLTQPRHMTWNVAAHESSSKKPDRNLVTYVRGGFADKTGEGGESISQYLRKGTTWSAIAAEYRNLDGRVVTIAQVIYLKGSTTSSKDVKHQYLVLERAFSLRDLKPFGESDFNVRKLKDQLDDAFVRDEFSPYQERFCALLGIESPLALKLLHKTQSTKNLDDINRFLRDFMLDEPETFALADKLVEGFDELNAAHGAVVEARRQIQTLKPAKEHFDTRALELRAQYELEEARVGVAQYVLLRREQLLQDRIDTLTIELAGKQDEAERATAVFRARDQALQLLQAQMRAEGGDALERLQKDIEAANAHREERRRYHAVLTTACKDVGQPVPDNATGFANLQLTADRVLAAAGDDANTREQERYALHSAHDAAKARFEQLKRDLAELTARSSNIDPDKQRLRTAIADALHLDPSQLPFVGELVQIKPEWSAWQGAIERVLRGFATSILVEERHAEPFIAWVNEHHLGQDLAYHRMIRLASVRSELGPKSLYRRLELAKSPPHIDWLREELKSRFDYTCCDDLAEFKAATRAVTITGQIRHNATRYEKRDRYDVKDKRQWSLGFDNAEKVKLYKAEFASAGLDVIHHHDALREAKEREETVRRAGSAYERISLLRWSDVDVASAAARVRELEQQFEAARAERPQLEAMQRQIDQAAAERERAAKAEKDAVIASGKLEDKVATFKVQLREIRDTENFVLTPIQLRILDERFAASREAATLETLDRASANVLNGLHQDSTETVKRIGALEHLVLSSFQTFNSTWRAESDGLDISLASAPDYFAKLERLEQDNLPKFENHFFELLKQQGDENLTRLATALRHERQAIQSRLELVNESLSANDYNPNTFLMIESHSLNLPAPREFDADVKNAHSRFEGDREEAERRFTEFQRIVRRLGSNEPADVRWRDQVLDVRQHVEFVAKEFDRDTTEELDVLRGGQKKSGGQRQKLASTCLAAALRYQLAGANRLLPRFSTIALDEAFDKTDFDYTTAVMKIFTSFGFQMVVATPIKSVITLEPFIGGAVFVQFKDRSRSTLLPIPYDDEVGKLGLRTVDNAAAPDSDGGYQ